MDQRGFRHDDPPMAMGFPKKRTGQTSRQGWREEGGACVEADHHLYLFPLDPSQSKETRDLAVRDAHGPRAFRLPLSC